MRITARHIYIVLGWKMQAKIYLKLFVCLCKQYFIALFNTKLYHNFKFMKKTRYYFNCLVI